MFALRMLLLIALLNVGASYASGWHDYSLEIAPGFSVYRMNTFEVCLGQTGGSLLTCPTSYPGKVGPLVEYAVTKDFILAHHQGVRPDEGNPSIPSGDSDKAFYFAVRRSNSQVLGPFVPTEWKQSALPPISTVDWIAPKNPNFWLPLMGDLMFLAFVLVYQGWPILLVLVLVISLLWLYRRRAKGNENAA